MKLFAVILIAFALPFSQAAALDSAFAETCKCCQVDFSDCDNCDTEGSDSCCPGDCFCCATSAAMALISEDPPLFHQFPGPPILAEESAIEPTTFEPPFPPPKFC